MKTILRLCFVSLLVPLCAFADGSDDFDDNNKNTTKWGNDVQLSLGVLTEQNTHLEFTCNNPLSNDDTLRPWIAERFPVNADWIIQVDTFNSTAPVVDSVTAAGVALLPPSPENSELNLELYMTAFGPFTVFKGFDADLETSGVKVGSEDTGGLAGAEAVNGAIRIEYNGATKVATFLYDLDITDGYQWTELASYGIAGSGGTTTNTDWGLSDTDQLSLYVWGFSEGTTVSSGQVYLDNFSETGGVPSSGGPAPVPTGNFQFGFPTNNPLLIAIAHIGGNYSGLLPQVGRAYTLDVAQDESGKLMAIGTVEGVTDSTGNPQMASNIGGVKTVDGKPTVESKGAFSFMVDGQPGSSKGASTIPLEMVDIGGGSNGVIGTATGSATALGVPLAFKNTLIAAPETPDMQTNFRKGWSLQLDISQKTVNGKLITLASALLTLPSGEVVSFPEKKVKYSTTKGYKVNFTKGTNLSTSLIEKKTKIKITGLTFVQQNGDWDPTGGTIKYQFLGQKGVANLLDFEAP